MQITRPLTSLSSGYPGIEAKFLFIIEQAQFSIHEHHDRNELHETDSLTIDETDRVIKGFSKIPGMGHAELIINFPRPPLDSSTTMRTESASERFWSPTNLSITLALNSFDSR